ncbi:hypothetical protein pEaSNUABM50_00160 [Erwinia phage pEa_SNUABM_50]|uniref:Uncharacterized protein n=4 Tax=Eneladusvirus BF TaxID=2560751 RepID=A0A7L8ZMD9_9CAUD|nr:hypothetical protein FDH34_gp162 [Serratia phage BF]QOI71100.1 hypothetical protein pEaSNUABM12_00162 [Erwinia phage pEa_SNUABM_12]QOI71645.1 hypothetical protein pEaSNUABM47_00161 [Erwinia phage pEa_SNUABM_47]QOI72184.1 hypothetical protein pEaSNUABM50_00160 [Erwinia phage pEa_SNUABM_50]QXO11310.1 hypothetical protein pEaSNUABM19_00164 [Erwinia phage pEa_SNUABM_19]QXO12410.1 hypothetical protein pEaSNUABM49_00164 [Erwinia phage pEa_SNUABM_49]
MNDVYYRIIRSYEDDELLRVVTMQDFDEYDYDHSRFLCAKGTNERLQFSTEEKAIKFLNDNINLENIDPEFRVKTQNYNDKFYKD